MRQVSPSYSLSLPCHLLACCILPCHHLHFISCHHVHRICIRVRLLHPSIFPVDHFAIRHSQLLRRTPLVFFSWASVERSRNGPSLAKWPWYTTRRPPVEFRSIWRSFGAPTVNRVTAKSVWVLQRNPPSNSPKTPLSLRHALGRSITIAWAKTAPRLDSPSSLCLYICVPSRNSRMKP